MYFNFSNVLEENRIVTHLVTKKWAVHKQWCQISWSGRKFHYLTIKMLCNSCTGIYKFGNNTYSRRIRRRSNLGHIFRGKKKRVLWAWKYGNQQFRALSQNCEKRLLASSYLSVRPNGTTRFPLDGFLWKLIFQYFWKVCRENSSFINPDKNNG
jgi:hypothetical protein